MKWKVEPIPFRYFCTQRHLLVLYVLQELHFTCAIRPPGLHSPQCLHSLQPFQMYNFIQLRVDKCIYGVVVRIIWIEQTFS
jgi:hypothetical protein